MVAAWLHPSPNPLPEGEGKVKSVTAKSKTMKKVCIGIHVQAEPERLRMTVESLRRAGPERFSLVVLPDNPDEALKTYLAHIDLPTVAGGESWGAAACFNRLVAHSKADILILLESGARVGPGWLEHLLRAFESDPRIGLAGPSTNIAWNEQGVFARAGASDADIERTALEAATRFGDQIRTLEPLYSLADFCYAVRREVSQAVGAADERYADGPCWEMDYNIRAARAGWRGVWACAAYVHRAPFTARRRLAETRHFEASKRLYQDKFCGARLTGVKKDYRQHCRGDACANFAPANLIEIKRPRGTGVPPVNHAQDAPVNHAQDARATPVRASVADPLVTCIMPTHNRRRFVPQAVRCFLRQDYSNLELLVVDDGADQISDCLPESGRIRYLHLDRKMTVGAKRNLACEQARGEIIVHWDDDDWYPTDRVSRQINSLREGKCEVSGTSRILYLDLNSSRVWEYRYPKANSSWVGGNTLAYRKRFWARHKFPDIQVGEDSRFVWSAGGKLIRDLADPTLCVATAHAENTSRKDLNGVFWHSQSFEHVEALLGHDIYFYLTAGGERAWPLVSCIMPTFNRRPYIAQALKSFQQQDYPERELIVVDDGTDSIEDLIPPSPNIHYLRLPRRTSIGAKRNLACQQARGEIIAHWDDDDWYAPDRLRYQAAPILQGQADLTGLENAFVLQLPQGEFWGIDAQLHQRLFVGNVHGGTLVYRKELWSQGLRYPEINLAEDASLIFRATRKGKRLMKLSNPGVFVYVRHGGNAWREFAPGTFIDPKGWRRIPTPPSFPQSALAGFRSAVAAAM
jgi:glycosyltransferase involved in cell wall biosynthesis